MQIERLSADDVDELGGPTGTAARLRALIPDGDSVAAEVREIIAQVRERGDDAIGEYTRMFDTAGAASQPLRVSGEDLDRALTGLGLDVIAGLQVAIANVALVADAGVGHDTSVALPQGQQIALREVPVRSAAVYVPGGRAAYPSTVVMGVVTARSAGVLDVAVCAPPGRDGDVHPAILGTCRLCGVQRVYRMGGAQAIAALAYGTDTVSAVDVIVGPGNLYVQEAKHQLSARVGIDGFAGPSDLLIVLGGDVSGADVRLAALDMLAQGEHGQGSLVVGVSSSPQVCEDLAGALAQLTATVPAAAAAGDAAFAIVCVDVTRDAIELANAFAPEHLQLIGGEVEPLAPAIDAAGCLFVGADSATAFGDYVAGSNHVLPTGGAARFASTLSARHFRRRMTEVRIGRAAATLAAAGAPIARAEGFELHAQSMEARVRDNPDR